MINEHLRQDFQIDAEKLSWMSSMYLWADILFLLPAGFILDRYSIRAVILNALFVCIVGTFGFALTDSFTLASFFHFLSGIGNAFCFLACVVLVARWFPPRRQAFVIGCIVTMAFIGGMAAHTPFAYLDAYFGWRTATWINGGIGVLIWFWIAVTVQNYPQGNTNPAIKTITTTASFWPIFSNRQNWLAGSYTACLNLPIMVIAALWGASYLQTVYHLSSMTASNVVSFIFIGSMVGCPLVGWCSDRLGRRKPLMIIGALVSLLMVLPLVMGWPMSPALLILLFFLLGFFTSTQVIGYPLIAESNASTHTGLATGLASVIIMGGGGIGQVLFGWLMNYHKTVADSTYTFKDFQFAMWMFPIAIILALIAMVFTRETHCRSFS